MITRYPAWQWANGHWLPLDEPGDPPPVDPPVDPPWTYITTSPYKETQGGGTTPTFSGDTWTFLLPAAGSPVTPRRSDCHWGAPPEGTLYSTGQMYRYEAVHNGTLGAVGASPVNWHLMWQIHGPVNGAWPGPAMSLAVRDGKLYLGGGTGHPDHNWTTSNYEWRQQVGTWTDNVDYTVKIETLLSNDPDVGWVTIWVNGSKMLDHYQPAANSNPSLRAGTIYPGQDWVIGRTCLYRGTDSGTIPTYEQVMHAKVRAL